MRSSCHITLPLAGHTVNPSQTCITRIKCCCWLVSISSTSMFPSSPHTSALAGAGRAARTLDAALCNCPRSSHIHPQGLCHPSWCLCWSPLSSVKHACITALLISTTIGLCILFNTSSGICINLNHSGSSAAAVVLHLLCPDVPGQG